MVLGPLCWEPGVKAYTYRFSIISKYQSPSYLTMHLCIYLLVNSFICSLYNTYQIVKTLLSISIYKSMFVPVSTYIYNTPQIRIDWNMLGFSLRTYCYSSRPQHPLATLTLNLKFQWKRRELMCLLNFSKSCHLNQHVLLEGCPISDQVQLFS